MAGLIRIVTALAVLTAAVGGLNVAWPSWAEDLSRGELRAAEDFAGMTPRGPEHDGIAERSDARRRLLRGRAAGELSLFRVAARFGELNRTPESAPDRGWRMIEGRCDGERLCRQVLIWCETELESAGPERLQKMRRAWQEEL